MTAYLARAPRVLSAGGKAGRPVVARIATPDFTRELRASAAYNRANGVRVVGEPTVSALKVLEMHTGAGPATAVVEACVDSSAVRLVDSRGRTVPQPRQGRTRERFWLVRSGGRWLIDRQGFPDDPNC